MGLKESAAWERAAMRNTVGAFTGLARTPSSEGVMATSIYHTFAAPRMALKYAGIGMAHALGFAAPGAMRLPSDLAKAGAWGVGGYLNMRREMAKNLSEGRGIADLIESHVGADLNPEKLSTLDQSVMAKINGIRPNVTATEAIALRNKYGRSWEEVGGKGKYGHRKFGARTPMEHMRTGVKGYFKNVVSRLGIGINVGLAVGMSHDNLFDAHEGFAKQLASNMGAEAGFMLGGATGAALATAALGAGPIGWAGYAIGALTGVELGMGAAEIPWKIAGLGKNWGRGSLARRSGFQDSEQAYTMRQRAMQSIYRSQMNARSALGSEALSYHG